jgi:hypothetical protein
LVSTTGTNLRSHSIDKLNHYDRRPGRGHESSFSLALDKLRQIITTGALGLVLRPYLGTVGHSWNHQQGFSGPVSLLVGGMACGWRWFCGRGWAGVSLDQAAACTVAHAELVGPGRTLQSVCCEWYARARRAGRRGGQEVALYSSPGPQQRNISVVWAR